MLNSRFPSVFGDTPDATGLSRDEGETLYVPQRPRRARRQRAGWQRPWLWGVEGLPEELSLFIGSSLTFGQ